MIDLDIMVILLKHLIPAITWAVFVGGCGGVLLSVPLLFIGKACLETDSIKAAKVVAVIMYVILFGSVLFAFFDYYKTQVF